MLKFRLCKNITLSSLVIIFTACSSANNYSNKYQELGMQVQASGYEVITHKAASTVLNNISEQLEKSLIAAGYSSKDLPAIFLVNSGKCLALSQGNTLLISSALVEKLDDVAELAFIIAHETAHSLLQHSQKDLTTKQKQLAEMEADYYGLGLISYAGYNPWYAVDALIKAYSCNYWADINSHPPLQHRINAMTKQLSSLGFGAGEHSAQNRDLEKLKFYLK